MVQLIQTEKARALNEFTSGIAHDLNQPLNVTKIISQGILRDIEKGRFSLDEAKADLPEILNQMNKMADMVAHMRTICSLPQGRPKEAMDINVPVRDILKFVSEQYKNHHIQLIEHLFEGLPPVLIDRACIAEVCQNLVKNARFAVERSGKKPMTIEIRTGPGANGQEVVLEVVDNGIGIPEDVKPRVTEPFFTTKEPGQGVGLGLAICQQFIKDHHGRLEFESRAGEGSTFRVILPAV
jgi:signal transduction histidine kinase